MLLTVKVAQLNINVLNVKMDLLYLEVDLLLHHINAHLIYVMMMLKLYIKQVQQMLHVNHALQI